MTAQLYRTRITDLFEIAHPILAGGLMWLSDASYVSAVVNAGGMGFITSRSSSTLDTFCAQLDRCAELTNGRSFGVNLSTSRHTVVPLMDYLHAAMDRGVRFFETAGRAPSDALIAAIKRRNGVVIHKVPLVKHAQTAERLGVDAVTIVGMECGGHPGINTDMPAMLGGAIAVERLTIPFAIGGGIGTGRQLLAALAVGADAVTVGTRLVTAAEVTAHPAYKRRVVAADETNSVVAFAGNMPLGGAWRVLANATSLEVRRREAVGMQDYADFSDLMAGSLTAQGCYGEGDFDRGMVSLGPSACFIDQVAPVADIINTMIAEARDYHARLDRFATA
jgi:NAD(P)H-dependent flavin oxidoreductase YrpB (nitropropane dioxygenase family)